MLVSRHASAGIGTLHSRTRPDDANCTFVATKLDQQDSNCDMLFSTIIVCLEVRTTESKGRTREDGVPELLRLLKASRTNKTSEVLGS